MAVHMEAGAVLGNAHSLNSDHSVLTLEEAIQLPRSSQDEYTPVDSCNASVQAVFNTPDRIDLIVEALSLPTTQLSTNQTVQLKSLIAEFPDVTLSLAVLM